MSRESGEINCSSINGNRTALNGISYVYDTANRLLQGGSIMYTYDQNGNRITEDAKQYQYDWANRLTNISNGDENTSFTYDGDGSRTGQQKIVSGATLEASSYVYDPSQGIPRLLEEEIVSGPTLNYVYAGRLLEQTGSTNGNMFYHQDALGNTMAMTDMTGAAINTYRYDAFGASELVSGTTINNRQFTGHVSDNTGLIYMNARYYDPATGRFLTQDTVPGGPLDPLSYNLYAYCKNNPVAYVDPSGKWGACVHYTSTFLWARDAGFKVKQAILIALGCISVDMDADTTPDDSDLYGYEGEFWTEPEKFNNRMSWHFNRQYSTEGATEDTRKTHARDEWQTFEELRYSDPSTALYNLGRALHPLQDIDAHMDQGLYDEAITSPHQYGWNNVIESRNFDDPHSDPIFYAGEIVGFDTYPEEVFSFRYDKTKEMSLEHLEWANPENMSSDCSIYYLNEAIAPEYMELAEAYLDIYGG